MENNEKSGCLLAVQDGRIIQLDNLPDPVFAGKILGDGYAVEPENGRITAPAAGTVTDVQDTLHAYGIRTKDGLDILIHIGIDTVSMNGAGFKACVSRGDSVEAGQLLCEADIERIRQAGKPVETIVLITNMHRIGSIEIQYGQAKAGETRTLCYKKK